MTGEVLLEARGIARRYGARVALQAFDLTLCRGEVLGLLGLNGAGKSTALQILAGVLAPHAGYVRLCGHDLAGNPLAAKRQLGFLPEIPPLYPEARVDEYLAFSAALRAMPAVARAAAVARAKARCGLADVGGRTIRNLSKGYQQRLGIAQAIVHEPAVLLLDEPTVGLDPVQIREVRELIRTLGVGSGVLLSTHLLSEAESLCTRVVVLHEGRIAYDAAATPTALGLTMELRLPPAPARIAAIRGVTACVEVATGRFDIDCHDSGDVAERLAELAVREGWGLRALVPRATALEQVFVSITSGRATAAAA